MLQRTIFAGEHAQLRDSGRQFYEREVVPHRRAREKAGVVPREFWRKAGEHGLPCVDIDESCGGAGADRRAAAVSIAEQARLGLSDPGFSTHSDSVAPYVANHGTEAQKRVWLPAMGRRDLIATIVLTEPGAGRVCARSPRRRWFCSRTGAAAASVVDPRFMRADRRVLRRQIQLNQFKQGVHS
jgi:acyl-CoA dehydrogenase